jgi:hypothetical protein
VGFKGFFVVAALILSTLSSLATASELTLVVEDIHGWARSSEVHREVFEVSGPTCFDTTISSGWNGKKDSRFSIRIFGEVTPTNQDQSLHVSYTKQIQLDQMPLAEISERTFVVESNKNPARIEGVHQEQDSVVLWQRDLFFYQAPPPEESPTK